MQWCQKRNCCSYSYSIRAQNRWVKVQDGGHGQCKVMGPKKGFMCSVSPRDETMKAWNLLSSLLSTSSAPNQPKYRFRTSPYLQPSLTPSSSPRKGSCQASWMYWVSRKDLELWSSGVNLESFCKQLPLLTFQSPFLPHLITEYWYRRFSFSLPCLWTACPYKQAFANTWIRPRGGVNQIRCQERFFSHTTTQRRPRCRLVAYPFVSCPSWLVQLMFVSLQTPFACGNVPS